MPIQTEVAQNVSQVTANGGSGFSTSTVGIKYRTINQGSPMSHDDVDANFENLRKAINGIITDIDGVVDKNLTAELSNATLGYSESGKNYPVEKSSNKLYVNVPWVDTNTTYSTATSSNLGLVKIGYSESGKNYPVELSSGEMYVNVPWSNTNTWNANSNTVAGYVAAPGTDGGDKVWGTDSAGTPAWRASQTGGMSFNSSTGVLTISSNAAPITITDPTLGAEQFVEHNVCNFNGHKEVHPGGNNVVTGVKVHFSDGACGRLYNYIGVWYKPITFN